MNAIEAYNKANEAIGQLDAMITLLGETYGSGLTDHHVGPSAELQSARQTIATQLCLLRARAAYWAIADGAAWRSVPVK